MPRLRTLIGLLITLSAVAVACVLTVALWRVYMLTPWTRDGRVQVNVVDIAPEVPGTVVDVPVQDNQFVHKGDTLFQIDPSRFRLAIAEAQAMLDQRKQEFLLRQQDARRRAGLGNTLVSAEEVEQFRSTAAVAAALVQAAQASLDLAKLNLDRAVLHAPVDGWVTHLRLRVGDYVSVGVPRVAVIDSRSFWITGYFEETKLRHIHPGDPARITLMGYPAPLTGHVESITRGINVPDDRPDNYGLPDVNPVFTWVRLAQRIPVRIHIDRVPDGVTLAAGMTCSVSIGDNQPHWLRDAL